MEQELIAYLDRRFGKIDRQFEKVDQQFEGVDARFEETHRLIEENRRGIEENRSQIRHTTVMVEDLRSNLQAVAEGVTTVDQKLDRYREEIDSSQREDRDVDRGAHKALRKRVDGLELRVGRLESVRP